MRVSKEQLMRAVYEFLQPMRRGKIVSVNGLRADLNGLVGFGGNDGFIRTSPFGFIATPTPNTFAYYNNLDGDSLSPIILGYQHQKRPNPSGVGGSILYSTDASGDEVRAFIEAFNTGQIDFKSVDGSLIRMLPNGDIFLGSGTSNEPLILGNAFATIYNVHTHTGNLGGPTGPPLVPMSAAHVSAKVFTEI